MVLRGDAEGPREAGKERASSRRLHIAQRNCSTGEAPAVGDQCFARPPSEHAIYQSEMKLKGGRGGCVAQRTPTRHVYVSIKIKKLKILNYMVRSSRLYMIQREPPMMIAMTKIIERKMSKFQRGLDSLLK